MWKSNKSVNTRDPLSLRQLLTPSSLLLSLSFCEMAHLLVQLGNLATLLLDLCGVGSGTGPLLQSDTHRK